jgi:hypothetical protein
MGVSQEREPVFEHESQGIVVMLNAVMQMNQIEE